MQISVKEIIGLFTKHRKHLNFQLFLKLYITELSLFTQIHLLRQILVCGGLEFFAGVKEL